LLIKNERHQILNGWFQLRLRCFPLILNLDFTRCVYLVIRIVITSFDESVLILLWIITTISPSKTSFGLVLAVELADGIVERSIAKYGILSAFSNSTPSAPGFVVAGVSEELEIVSF